MEAINKLFVKCKCGILTAYIYPPHLTVRVPGGSAAKRKARPAPDLFEPRLASAADPRDAGPDPLRGGRVVNSHPQKPLFTL